MPSSGGPNIRPILLRARQGEGAERTTVKRIFKGDDPVATDLAAEVKVVTCEL